MVTFMLTSNTLDDDKTAMACWLSFSSTQKILVETVDQELKEQAGLDLGDFELLSFVYGSRDQRARMAEIADATVSPKSRLTYQVDQLEKKGYLKRTACPQDRRGLYAELTQDGADLVERSTPVYANIIRTHFTEPVGPDSMLEMLRISNTIRRAVLR
jgi:DNA-binding MarR family transcriptional regulator